jgi:hypothetical protein
VNLATAGIKCLGRSCGPATSFLAATALLALLSACGSSHVVRLDAGYGTPLEHRPPTLDKSVLVSKGAFEESLTNLVLSIPLSLRPLDQGWVAYASYPGGDEQKPWQYWARKGFGGLCVRGQPKDDCLSLLDDVMGLSSTDKLTVALTLSFGPMRESIAEAVQDTLAPQLFYSIIATGVVTWAVMAANPEPVFTKTAAAVSALMLIYLGQDTFLKVLDASFELKQATDKATTWEELEEASQHFGRKVGPQVARVFILAVTVMVSRGMTGGAAWMASRVPMLPSFAEASALGASQLGVRLSNVGQVSMVAVVEGNLAISLAPTAVAMAINGVQGGGAAAGNGSTAYRSWGSFSGLKSALGSAGPGKQWHHIVEQTPGNVERFGPHSIHNTENVIALDERVHRQLSAYYSSKDPRFTGGQTVRQWLSNQSFQAQREFGLKILQDYGVVP